jgi:PAS domain S-box-containing protein
MATDILKLDVLEQRFQSLFHEAPFSAALLVGDEFKIEMANSISLALWGKDSSIIGKPLLQAIPEIKDQEVHNILKDVYRSGETYEGREDVAHLQKDGELKKVYVNLVYKAIKDAGGKVTGVLAVGYDVTDQVLQRKKLQESETRIRVAIESTGLGTFEKDFKSGKIRTSQRFDEIFGLSNPVEHEQYVSRFHPDDLEIRNNAQKQALETGRLRYEARILLAENTVRWVKINGSIIRDDHGAPHLLIGTGLDITEEKLSFEKLQESEERFRTLITETPEVGVGLYLGRELRIQYVNEVMLKFWGKDVSVIGKTWKQVLPELESQPFFKQLDDVFTTGSSFTGKEVKALLERNGKLEVGYYNYTYKALKNLHGQIYAIHHMAVDVTEQVKSKLRLIASEQNVRKLFEQTPVGIAMLKGEQLKIKMINDTLLSFWARQRQEVINRPLWEVLPEVAEQGLDRIAKQVYDTGVTYKSPESPVDLFRDGKLETIIVHFAFQALKDWQGEIIGLLVIATDVTELVTARKAVEKNEMRLKFMADSMPQVVWIGEHDGKVKYYNKRVLQFTGVKQDEEGNYIWDGLVHPDDLQATSEKWMQSINMKTPYEVEHRIKMNDGTFRWHLSRAYAYETEEGTKWYGTSTNVHDQKMLEMNLETIVRERTLELQRSNDDLQQFAHVASHDLKEPARKIKTFSYKLQDEYKTVLGERGNNFVNKIINASDRMYSMINGVLNYASMPASAIKSERIDLAEVIRNVEIDLELLVQEKAASITFENLPVIHGMVDLIYQLFYNLINNSLKFSRTDVPSIIRLEGKQEQMFEGRTFYEIVLTDNGIGFEQEYAEQIFSTFFRLNSKDQYEGSGLGLALCKKIVERHGGRITAKGETNKGAQFHILLPQ